VSRICAYELCTKDLDELGKRPDARYCSSWHKDQQRRLDERSAAEKAAERNRETRAITLTFERAVSAAKAAFEAAIRDVKAESPIRIEIDLYPGEIDKVARQLVAAELTPAARKEYDRRKAAK
jgi:hypothetical protein